MHERPHAREAGSDRPGSPIPLLIGNHPVWDMPPNVGIRGVHFPLRSDYLLIMRALSWRVRVVGAGAAGLALIAAFAYFQPQKLLVNQRVEEGVPGSPHPALPQRGTESPDPETVLSSASVKSLEHESSGTVLLIQLASGQRIVRFENLSTSNGPDLRVYLSAAPASSDWRGYDREYLDLGALKGNLGSQNYVVPDGTDLGRYRSAVIWCRRFSVGFAVAPLS